MSNLGISCKFPLLQFGWNEVSISQSVSQYSSDNLMPLSRTVVQIIFRTGGGLHGNCLVSVDKSCRDHTLTKAVLGNCWQG